MDAGEAHPLTQAFFSDFVTNLHHGTTVPGETNKSCCKAAHSLIEALEFPVSACHPPFRGTVRAWSPSTAPGSSDASRVFPCAGATSPCRPGTPWPPHAPSALLRVCASQPQAFVQVAALLFPAGSWFPSPGSEHVPARAAAPEKPEARPTNDRAPHPLCVLRARQCKALASRSSPTLPRSMPRLWNARRSSSPPSARACAWALCRPACQTRSPTA